MKEKKCCEVFNLWRSERLMQEYSKSFSLLGFMYEQEKLSLLMRSGVKLSQKDQRTAELSQGPRELLLTPKELAKLNNQDDEKAISSLFQLTGDEEDLICKYFFPTTQTLRSDHKRPETPKGLSSPLSEGHHHFTHGN